MEFQSTLPRRERLFSIFNSLLFCIISIHAPAKGATTEICPKLPCSDISIHAPAKGATDPAMPCRSTFHISIHAPAKGATTQDAAPICAERYFNPRSREGSDQKSLCICWACPEFQSTLPRRERRYSILSSCPFVYFNPRSREGSDGVILKVYDFTVFISIHAPAKGATGAG